MVSPTFSITQFILEFISNLIPDKGWLTSLSCIVGQGNMEMHFHYSTQVEGRIKKKVLSSNLGRKQILVFKDFRGSKILRKQFQFVSLLYIIWNSFITHRDRNHFCEEKNKDFITNFLKRIFFTEQIILLINNRWFNWTFPYVENKWK